VDRSDETKAAARDPGSEHPRSRHSGSLHSFSGVEPIPGFAEARREQSIRGGARGHESKPDDSEAGKSAASHTCGIHHAGCGSHSQKGEVNEDFTCAGPS
jgi:hypothetical protein